MDLAALDTARRKRARHGPLRMARTRTEEVETPELLVWGREDEVFDHTTFATRFKELVPHAEGPELLTGRHFLQEDSGEEISGKINRFLDGIEGRQP